MLEVKAYKCEICGHISEKENDIIECEKNKPYQYAKSGDICRVKTLGDTGLIIIRFKNVTQEGHDFYYDTEDVITLDSNWSEYDHINRNYDFERLFVDLELLGNELEGFNAREYIKDYLL